MRRLSTKFRAQISTPSNSRVIIYTILLKQILMKKNLAIEQSLETGFLISLIKKLSFYLLFMKTLKKCSVSMKGEMNS